MTLTAITQGHEHAVVLAAREPRDAARRQRSKRPGEVRARRFVLEAELFQAAFV